MKTRGSSVVRPKVAVTLLLPLGLVACGGGGRAQPEPVPGKIEAVALEARAASAGMGFTALTAEESGVAFQMGWGGLEARIGELMLQAPLGGVATGDYDGDGQCDFYVTSPSGGGRLYRNVGGLRFEDVTEACGLMDDGLWGTGVNFVDLDNDGDLDLHVCAFGQADRVYLNEGGEVGGGVVRFKETGGASGLGVDRASMSMAFADIDNDGDLDGYLATTGKAPPDGTKFQVRFEKRADGVEVPVVLEELREYWELIYLPDDRAKRVEAGQYDRVFRNGMIGGDGKLAFTDVTEAAGTGGGYFTLGVSVWDRDADGWVDFYVANDFTGPDQLWENRRDGSFENVLGSVVPYTPWLSMGTDVADLNNDGRIDLVATDMAATTHYREKVAMGEMDEQGWFLDWAEPRQYMRNAVYLNSGEGRVMEAAAMLGLAKTDWTWSVRLEDFDSDGRVDAFFSNGAMRDTMDTDVTQWAEANLKPRSKEYTEFWLGKPMRKEKNLAFVNRGELGFEEVGAAWGLDREGVTFGVATADFDGDGDLDLVTSSLDVPVRIYRNDSVGENLVNVRLEGTVSNRMGIGAHVRVKSARSGEQVRYVTITRGWQSSSDALVHFGLGVDEVIDELVVEWPSGRRQVFEGLAANRLYRVREPSIEDGSDWRDRVEEVKPVFEEIGALAGAVHEENEFDDFAVQPLLPNRQSRPGPVMVWGDVDGDGDEDFYQGGATGFEGQLWLNGGGGKFDRKASPAIAADKYSEDTGAAFFDADGDGDLDLLVASGGYEAVVGDLVLRDRLYLNDGSGEFVAGELPDGWEMSGPVAVGDVDGDGDLDVFIGCRGVPRAYPLVGKNRLLVNDGGGRFVERTPVGLKETGLVTGAVFSDADGDGQQDLLLTHEWGAVRVFFGGKGEMEERDCGVEGLSGWWTGIAGGDVDGDGDVDYLVTNFGLNTKYSASVEKPVVLYYGDLDGSGKAHLVEAKVAEQGLLPRRGFSCSSGAMPVLRDKLKTFHNFASATLEEVYEPERLVGAMRLEANTLETGVLVNDGTGRFEFRALPRLAQVSPTMAGVLEDLDGDGATDCFLGQNFSGPQRETPRMTGGLSVFLRGDGTGGFEPVPAEKSGVLLGGDATAVAVVDVDGDGVKDVVVARHDDSPALLLNRSGEAE